jgi:hypothetical protein
VRADLHDGLWSRLRARAVASYPRPTRLLILILIIFAAWALAWNGVTALLGVDAPSCTFRRVTGMPCATCGGTRAALRLFRGDLLGALQLNPLATLITVGVPAWLITAWIRRGTPLIRWTRARWLWATLALVVVVAANWIYVVRTLDTNAHAPSDTGARSMLERAAGLSGGTR